MGLFSKLAAKIGSVLGDPLDSKPFGPPPSAAPKVDPPPIVSGGHDVYRRVYQGDLNRLLATWRESGQMSHYGNSFAAERSNYEKLLPEDEGSVSREQIETIAHLQRKSTMNRILSQNILDKTHACFSDNSQCRFGKQPDLSKHPAFILKRPVSSGVVHVTLKDVTPGRVPYSFWDQYFDIGKKTKLDPAAVPIKGKKPNTPFQSFCATADGPHLYEFTVEEEPDHGNAVGLAERIQMVVKEPISECYCRPFEQGCRQDNYVPDGPPRPVVPPKIKYEVPLAGPVVHKTGEIWQPASEEQDDEHFEGSNDSGLQNIKPVDPEDEKGGGPLFPDGTVPRVNKMLGNIMGQLTTAIKNASMF